MTLFDQGQVLEVSGLLHYLPQARRYIIKSYARWATVDDDQMIGIVKYTPNYDGLENWREAGQAASPVALPQAQGTGREVRALLG